MYLEFRILDDKKARATVRELRRIVTRPGPPAAAKRGKDRTPGEGTNGRELTRRAASGPRRRAGPAYP